MIATNRWMVITAFLIAALVSYGIGFTFGVTLFVFLGCILELGFWVGLFNSTSKDEELPKRN